MEEHTFLAGAARENITPGKKLMPMPLIWGIRFTRVLDQVHVRALALSDGERKSLFIIFEMTLVPYADETLRFVAEVTGIPKEQIFIAATHTHGVTPVSLGIYKEHSRAEKKCRKWYEEVILPALKAAVNRAQSRMVPARYGYGTGQSYINVNRDAVFGSESRIGSNFERPSDRTIRMVRIESLSGRLIALIVNYACHAVVMNGCLRGLGTGLTGDLPGRTCSRLEAELDGGVVLWCSGAAGDQNPRIMTQYGGTREKGKPVLKNLGKAGYTILEYLSDEHARDIRRAARKIRCTENTGTIYCAEKTAMVRSRDSRDAKIPYTLRLFMIGDIAFEGISAEIVTSVGKAVREVSPYEKTILVSHALGYQGYVADDWEYEHNAFEAGSAKTAKGAAQEAFVSGFGELFREKEQTGHPGGTPGIKAENKEIQEEKSCGTV
ncbi:hypothetical protein B5F07_09055 [Lachnoclostridium sp. An169]|uniref:hypothetical protein n=1 Tax=Lachnoclostridium sp. An169 TaxID=1965569 RepID=UPI000B3A72F4|nr:hypothetical protein [Lachnoclostridium sp. An169]OUP83990.1 hypothetical protein B5F07_09055 [Lachnoclostridium sp. An169]